PMVAVTCPARAAMVTRSGAAAAVRPGAPDRAIAPRLVDAPATVRHREDERSPDPLMARLTHSPSARLVPLRVAAANSRHAWVAPVPVVTTDRSKVASRSSLRPVSSDAPPAADATAMPALVVQPAAATHAGPVVGV